MTLQKNKNVLRDANMKIFSTNAIDRYIIIDEDSTDEEKDRFVKKINDRLGACIQEVNAIVENRILPYVVVRRVMREEKYIRIIINDIDSPKKFNEMASIKISDLSHLINFKTFSPHRRIMVSDDVIPGNAKMIIDKDDQVSAAIDIYLDIAMFNSFSFLRDLPLNKKIDFNSLKYSYFKNINEKSYYHFSETYPPAYYSFAFTARTDGKNIDFEKYINLWDNFISTYYQEYNNIIPLVSEQLKLHKDAQQIDKLYFDDNFWINQDNGDFLFLRINREPHDHKEKSKLLNYFGKSEFNVGETTVVPIKEYRNPFLRKNINELFVSAYKIVNKSNNCINSAITKGSYNSKNYFNGCHFKIGITFSGKYRNNYVKLFCDELLKLGYSQNDIFYDHWHDALINGVKGDKTLKKIYLECCDCVVVLITPDYSQKKWTGIIEWSAIKDLINTGNEHKVCLLSVDVREEDINELDGISSNQAIVKAIDDMPPDEIAKFIDLKYKLLQ